MEQDCLAYEDTIVDSFTGINFCIVGDLTFKSAYFQDKENDFYRFKAIDNLMEKFCNIISMRRDKLAYYIKDEISKGINHPTGKGHSHLLIGSHNLRDSDCPQELGYLSNLIQSIWVGKNYKAPRHGTARIEPIEQNNMITAIRYTAKVWSKKNNTIVFNNHRCSKQLKKQQKYLNKLSEELL